jgi:GT2 family glycosyltransferase
MTSSNHSNAPAAHAGPKVGVIVLTWNGKDLTLQCLESLSRLDYDRADIVVVDNASTDGTAEAIRTDYGERVTLIVNEENLGFAGGNNIGIRHALDKGSDYVLLLNNDTVVDPRLLDSLVEVISRSPDIGIVGPKIYFASPSNKIWFAGGEVFLWRGLARHIGIRQVDEGQFDSIRAVDYISGCALLARSEVFEKVGFLDESYQTYFEDTDFCMRAKRHNYRILYVPDGKVWHMISSSAGGQLGRRKIVRKLKSSFRFFRHYAAPYQWLTIPLFFALDIVRILVLISTGRIRDEDNAKKAVEQRGNHA